MPSSRRRDNSKYRPNDHSQWRKRIRMETKALHGKMAHVPKKKTP